MAKRRRSGETATGRRWRELVERWQRSGQTVREFCRGAEVKESAFYWWRRALARKELRRPSPRAGRRAAKKGVAGENPPAAVCREAARFLPVEVVMAEAGERASGVEIHWGSARAVRLCRGFDRQTLAEALAVLESRPC